MISIIIPLYNKRKTIYRTLQSILTQKEKNYEVIVVDDGSSDNGSNIVNSIDDNRIHFFRKENGGVSSARNFGILKSSGEWIMFLDADDELCEGALMCFSRLTMKYPDIKFFVGGIIRKNIILERKYRSYQSFSPYFDIWRNKILPASGNIIVHRSLIKAYGCFDERLSFFEDYEFALRLMFCGKVVFTEQPIRIYHQEPGGLSTSSHELTKDMAYYLPEQIGKYSFWGRVLWYENLEYMLNWNSNNELATQYYRCVRTKFFSPFYEVLHSIRQRLINHHYI